MSRFLEYEVLPGSNVPQGLPRMRLPVLSPIWTGPALYLEYPDLSVHTLVGWTGPGAGRPCAVRVFWTRHQGPGLPVCLALGGDGGLRDLGPEGGLAAPQGLPFLALAESLIPAEVLEVIGPPPEPKPSGKPPLLLG